MAIQIACGGERRVRNSTEPTFVLAHECAADHSGVRLVARTSGDGTVDNHNAVVTELDDLGSIRGQDLAIVDVRGPVLSEDKSAPP